MNLRKNYWIKLKYLINSIIFYRLYFDLRLKNK